MTAARASGGRGCVPTPPSPAYFYSDSDRGDVMADTDLPDALRDVFTLPPDDPRVRDLLDSMRAAGDSTAAHTTNLHVASMAGFLSGFIVAGALARRSPEDLQQILTMLRAGPLGASLAAMEDPIWTDRLVTRTVRFDA